MLPFLFYKTFLGIIDKRLGKQIGEACAVDLQWRLTPNTCK